jgi:hypothetical protein
MTGLKNSRWPRRAGAALLVGQLNCGSSSSTTASTPSDAGVDGTTLGQPIGSDGGLAANAAGKGNPSAPDGAGLGNAPTTANSPSVLRRHKNLSRDGLYVDPAMTRSAVRGLHADPAFTPTPVDGPVYAQPLYVENGVGGKDTIYVATEQDIVYAIDAANGGVLWQRTLGSPVPQNAFLPKDCVNLDPTGITGTPVIDLNSRTLFVDAITTDDSMGITKAHLVFGLSLDDGSVRNNYPVDVVAKLAAKGIAFDPGTEGERGGLTIVENRLYVPYGGYAGDCGVYRGTVVGIPIENPKQVYFWQTATLGGGIWGVGGPASDGHTLFVATGNATDTGAPSWGGSEAVVRLGPGPTFSGRTSDYFTPSNWRDLDELDLELGATQPLLLDRPGDVHPKLVVAMSKAGNVYVLDRDNLGGQGTGDGGSGEGLTSAHLSSSYIINAPTAYTTAGGTSYIVFKGVGVDCPTGSTLVAAKLPGGTAPALSLGWCAAPDSSGSPVASTTDGHAEPVVWTIGADGDGQVNAFDGETGALLFAGVSDGYHPVARYQSPIIVKGRVIWASNDSVFAFTVR